MKGMKNDGLNVVPMREAKLTSMWEIYGMCADNWCDQATLYKRIANKKDEEIKRGFLVIDDMSEAEIKEHMEKYLKASGNGQHHQR